MNVLVTTEHRFTRSPDGAVWTSGTNAYGFWQRYLATFDRVKVAARLQDVDQAQPGYQRADGPGVVFLPLPNYLGPAQYVKSARRVDRALRDVFDPQDAVILRVSSHLAGCLEPLLTSAGHPYGLEVVNDPLDVFAPGAVTYHLRPLFRWWFTRQLRRQCGQAVGVAYVTSSALQRRYPCGGYRAETSGVDIAPEGIVRQPNAFTTNYSSVELSRDGAVASARRASQSKQSFRLITVASLAQMYKAPDILIRAVACCVKAGLDLKLAIVGDGKHRPEMERLAARQGIPHRVQFLGQLPAGSAVRSELDASDLFVLPSRGEGLPRAMVEAMARALPCIGSTVGGIPELLAEEDLVPPGDVDGLAEKIHEVLSSPARMSAMSARNLERAREYRDDVLASRRKAFFDHIRKATSDWLAGQCEIAKRRDPEWQSF